MRKRASPRFVDAGPIIDGWLASDPELRARVEDEHVNFEIAQAVYDIRALAGLTQRRLASLAGTTQPVIARLEDADYRGHSLRMLLRIATAVGRDLEICFVPRAESPAGRGGTRARRGSKATGTVVILDRMTGADPERRARLDGDGSNDRLAHLVRDARVRARLTQERLARLVGTTQPVIARLENAAYRGHSLRLLGRIAAALKQDLEIRFVPRAG